MTNDTDGSNFTSNHHGTRIWDLYAFKWENDNSLWEDAASNLFDPANVLDAGLNANTIYNANPLSLTVNGRLTDSHFQLNGVDYGSDTLLKANTISAEKHPLRDSNGTAYPGLPNLNISDNIMYWSASTQLIDLFEDALGALLSTSFDEEDFVLIKSSDGKSASGVSGSWVGDLTAIKQGEFYEVHVAPGISINLSTLGKLFYNNDYMQLANDNITTSISGPNNISVSNMGRASTAMHIYDDYFQNIEDIFSASDKYFDKETLWVSNLPKENYMTSVTNIGATWQVA